MNDTPVPPRFKVDDSEYSEVDVKTPLVTEPIDNTNALEARRCLINVVLMSVSFFFIFTAFGAIQNLEASIRQGNLGSVSLTALYFVNTLCCLFSPVLVDYMTPRYALAIGMLTYTIFVVTNFPQIADYYTLVPASALLGFGASFMWPAQGVYMTANAVYYSHSRGEPQTATIGFFNGIFWSTFQMTQIVGNLISSLVLSSSPSDNIQNVLFGIFLGSSVIGNVLILFVKVVPPLPTLFGGSPDSSTNILATNTRKPIKESLTSMVRLLFTAKMGLLIPYIFYVGFEQQYIFSDFTTSMVNSTLGSKNIGFVMTSFGAVDVVASFCVGKLSDIIGRVGIMLFGLVLHGCLATFLVFWKLYMTSWSTNSQWAIAISIASLWGIGDAIGNPLLSALIGSTFNDQTEAGFSNMKFFQCLAFALGFAFSSIGVSFMVETIIMLGSIVVSIICFSLLALLFQGEGINKPRAEEARLDK